MKNDLRYSEMLFLQALEKGPIYNFWPHSQNPNERFDLASPFLYAEMVAALIEDLYVEFRDPGNKCLVGRLRGEIFGHIRPSGISDNQWDDPRRAIFEKLSAQSGPGIQITYRGLRRIEELRELLQRDRILEPFGVLLSIQYFRRDLSNAIQRGPDTPVSVLYADMDDFGKINKKFGQDAGDVVMKDYLEVVHDKLGVFGAGYRGLGDETVSLIVGQGHQRAVEIAESIRKAVESRQCEHRGAKLPKVTVSMGVASSPPDPRTQDLQTLADERKLTAKNGGKNRVVAS